jgi:hypothetical protein
LKVRRKTKKKFSRLEIVGSVFLVLSLSILFFDWWKGEFRHLLPAGIFGLISVICSYEKEDLLVEKIGTAGFGISFFGMIFFSEGLIGSFETLGLILLGSGVLLVNVYFFLNIVKYLKNSIKRRAS